MSARLIVKYNNTQDVLLLDINYYYLFFFCIYVLGFLKYNAVFLL